VRFSESFHALPQMASSPGLRSARTRTLGQESSNKFLSRTGKC
jgi:hypothetical protein